MLGRVNVSASRRWLRPATLVLGVLVLTAAVAAAGGWGWWKWWSPAPHGTIAKRIDTGAYGWYATPYDPGQAHVASSTFEYVVVGFVLAFLVGLIVGLVGRNRALLALGSVVLASALGAYVMRQVGIDFSPPDPSQFADAGHFGKNYPGSLTIGIGHLDFHLWRWLGSGHIHFRLPTPYLVWPVGALLGFLVVMLTITTEEKKAVEETSVGGPASSSDLASR
jgi:hypothetical protein